MARLDKGTLSITGVVSRHLLERDGKAVVLALNLSDGCGALAVGALPSAIDDMTALANAANGRVRITVTIEQMPEGE